MTTQDRLIELAREAREGRRTGDYGALLAALGAVTRPDPAAGVHPASITAAVIVLERDIEVAVGEGRFAAAEAFEDVRRLLLRLLEQRGDRPEQFEA